MTIASLNQIVELVKNVPGDIAEFGCYEGESTIQIAEHFRSRRVWAWDTFEGMPDDDYIEELDKTDPPGKWKPSLDVVKKFASTGLDIAPVRGKFSETIPVIDRVLPNLRFAFVHIDADHYNAYRRVLEFVAPRMSPGGVIRVDDYGCCPGAKRAVDQFLRRSGKSLEGDLIRF